MPKIQTKIVRSKRKTLALQILSDATVLVKAPLHLPRQKIQSFLDDHTDWIEKHTQLVSQMPAQLPKTYQEGEPFLFLGQEYALHFGNYSSIEVKNNLFLFPVFLKFRIEKELTSWYMKKAQEIITNQVDWYAEKMGVSYNGGLTFSDTKSRWGSCTHDNRLQFNWRLVMAPLLVVNYVVVHELVHTAEKNHSRSFWNKVRAHSPSYRQQIKWLKTHGDGLFVT